MKLMLIKLLRLTESRSHTARDGFLPHGTFIRYLFVTQAHFRAHGMPQGFVENVQLLEPSDSSSGHPKKKIKVDAPNLVPARLPIPRMPVIVAAYAVSFFASVFEILNIHK